MSECIQTKFVQTSSTKILRFNFKFDCSITSNSVTSWWPHRKKLMLIDRSKAGLRHSETHHCSSKKRHERWSVRLDIRKGIYKHIHPFLSIPQRYLFTPGCSRTLEPSNHRPKPRGHSMYLVPKNIAARGAEVPQRGLRYRHAGICGCIVRL